ncbi:MAG: hypothetical protein EXR45_05720 [Chloroflexi bacterium]|nr:hypothetical protein [Chloroflexota bacterium]
MNVAVRCTGKDSWRSLMCCFGLLLGRLRMGVVNNAPLVAWMVWAMTAGRLPRAVRLWLAALVGEAAYWAMPVHRRATLRNVRAIRSQLPLRRPVDVIETTDRRTARETWRNYACILSDIVDLVTVQSTGINRLVSSVTGWEHIEKGLASGKGLIIACAHLGNWEVAGTVLASRYPVLAIADPIPPDGLNQCISESRSSRGIRTVPPTLAGVREVRRMLSQGGIVVVLVDRPGWPRHKSGFAEVPFMGLPTWVPAGVARLATASGAPVVAAGAVMDPTSRYRVFSSAPMRFESDASVESVLTTILSALQPLIAKNLNQWFMFREMWPFDAGSGMEDDRPSGSHFAASGATSGTNISPQEIVIHAGFTLGSILPRAAIEGITGAAGRLAISMPNNRAVGLSQNHALVLGHPPEHVSVRKSVKESVGLHFENYADLLRGPRIGRGEIEERSEISGTGWDVVKASVGRGSGAILMSAHFGRVELLGHVLENLDIPVTLMVERLRPTRLHELVSRNRKRARFSVVTPDLGARPVWRALDRGDLVVAFTDWVPPLDANPANSPISSVAVAKRSFAIPMYGGEIHFPAVPYRIAARRRLPLLFGYGRAFPGGRVQAVIEAQCAGNEPRTEAPTSDGNLCGYVRWTGSDDDAARAASEVGNRFGNLLRRHPDQWTLGHHVWDPY